MKNEIIIFFLVSMSYFHLLYIFSLGGCKMALDLPDRSVHRVKK